MLFPSLWEGLPGVVLEACAAETRTLASDLPGVQEIAEHSPLVTSLSLEADDRQWADRARELQRESRDSTPVPAFPNEIFGIEDCASAHCRVWDGLSVDGDS